MKSCTAAEIFIKIIFVFVDFFFLSLIFNNTKFVHIVMKNSTKIEAKITRTIRAIAMASATLPAIFVTISEIISCICGVLRHLVHQFQNQNSN